MNEGMNAYTRWWIAHPWHVSSTSESGKVPPDCDCEWCESNRQARLVDEGTPDVLVLYDGTDCVGNLQFENHGPHKCGANLRWMGKDWRHRCIHFVGATRDGILTRVSPGELVRRIRQEAS